VSILNNLKHTFEDKIESYEASAAMIACLLVAACFLLVGGAIWLADAIGPVWSCVSFGAGFLFLAVCCWFFGRAKASAADHEIEQAKHTVTNTIRAASNTVEAFSTKTPGSLGSIDVILGGGLLVLLIYLGAKPSDPSYRL
jgi:hypothetical protein